MPPPVRIVIVTGDGAGEPSAEAIRPSRDDALHIAAVPSETAGISDLVAICLDPENLEDGFYLERLFATGR